MDRGRAARGGEPPGARAPRPWRAARAIPSPPSPGTPPSCSRCCSRSSRPAGSTCRSTPTSPPDEVGYILGDSGAAALIADAAFARGRPGGGGVGRRARRWTDRGRRRHPRLHATRRSRSPTNPTPTPADRVAGQFMQYTSGTTGRPKAVQRDLPQFDPETWVAALQRQPDPLRHRARRRRGAPGHVADVPHVAAVVRLLLAALRAHRRADGAVGRRARARS